MTAPIINGYVEYDGFTWMFTHWPTIEPASPIREQDQGGGTAERAPWSSSVSVPTIRIDDEGQAWLYGVPQTVTTEWVISKELTKTDDFRRWSPSPGDFADTRTLVMEGGRVVEVIDGVRPPTYTLKERFEHGLYFAVFLAVIAVILGVLGAVASILMRMVSWIVSAL